MPQNWSGGRGAIICRFLPRRIRYPIGLHQNTKIPQMVLAEAPDRRTIAKKKKIHPLIYFFIQRPHWRSGSVQRSGTRVPGPLCFHLLVIQPNFECTPTLYSKDISFGCNQLLDYYLYNAESSFAPHVP